MIITTILEAVAVLLFLAGLLNEPRLIEWERRTGKSIMRAVRQRRRNRR